MKIGDRYEIGGRRDISSHQSQDNSSKKNHLRVVQKTLTPN